MLKNTKKLKKTNMTELHLDNQGLAELDLSPYPNLELLYCANNKLSKLDLSHTPNLHKLWCPNNNITHLDFSSTPNLFMIGCAPTLTPAFLAANKVFFIVVGSPA